MYVWLRVYFLHYFGHIIKKPGCIINQHVSKKTNELCVLQQDKKAAKKEQQPKKEQPKKKEEAAPAEAPPAPKPKDPLDALPAG